MENKQQQELEELEELRKKKIHERKLATARARRYYHKNKEKLKQKISCPCGGRYTATGKYLHKKTKIHTKYLEELEDKKDIQLFNCVSCEDSGIIEYEKLKFGFCHHCPTGGALLKKNMKTEEFYKRFISS